MELAHESVAGMPDLVESLKCPQCGGPLTLGPGDVIVTCPYCGSTSRIRSENPFLLRHGMLAARLDTAGATAVAEGWLDGGFLKPSDLRRASRITSLECVYIPFYVFEVDVTTSYSGVLTRTGSNERRSGSVPRDYFWKVLGRRGSDFPTREYKIPLAYKVPFDTAGMVRGSSFLNAEFDEDEAARLAREQVEAHERELLKDAVDEVEDAHSEISVKDTEFLHAPVWLAAFVYRGRPYRIIIDGASGEIVRGDIPPPTGGVGEFLKDAGRSVFGR